MTKKLSLSIITAFLALLLTMGIIWAWTEPSVAPPGGNVDAPLNVSINAQAKDGPLVVGVHSSVDSVPAGFIVQHGKVGIGTAAPGYKLDVDGNVAVTSGNAFVYASDIALKKDITPLENSLAKILNLEGVSFRWKDSNELSIGLIAQEVEKIFPEIVFVSEDSGLKSIDYITLVVPLIDAIKEQQAEIDELRLEIEKLKD